MELSIREQQKRALALTGIGLALLLMGFYVGHDGGADVDSARAAGTKAGTAAGTKSGKVAGFTEGKKKGQTTAYKAAYSQAYAKAKNGD